MNRITKFVLAALGIAIVVSTAAPVNAQQTDFFPERWSMNMYDISGFWVDCVDVVKCNQATCPMNFFFGGPCSYANITETTGPGQTATTFTCQNHVLAGFFPTKQLNGTITCDKRNISNWSYTGGTPGPGACSITVQEKNVIGFGSFTESMSGITINGYGPPGPGGTCIAWLTSATRPGGDTVKSRTPRTSR